MLNEGCPEFEHNSFPRHEFHFTITRYMGHKVRSWKFVKYIS
jgi:hypothetical protein